MLAHFSEDAAHRLKTLQEALVLYNDIVRTGGYAEVSEAITIIDAAAGKKLGADVGSNLPCQVVAGPQSDRLNRSLEKRPA